MFSSSRFVRDHYTYIKKKWKFSHHPLTPTLVESQVKFHSPENIPGASQINSLVKQCCSILLNNWCRWRLLSKSVRKQHKMAPWSPHGELQVSRNPGIPNWLEKTLFTPFFKLAIEALACTPVHGASRV